MYDWEQQAQYYCDLADKRLELLKKAYHESLYKGWCSHCTMTEVDTFCGHEHDPDCELAEAIAEE